ncbi:MAG TPA: D-alanyl-D-alanine carboxypeptidase/D-alanyl-D-alanine-endopeptidase [Candidatus Kapabacteria bacterium]|nr:D-alanyl-D-alanine carboxypeptidase/D-alanyl-D-alanine-endopeptidase [Candidatus Kapabacteria bacterium]
MSSHSHSPPGSLLRNGRMLALAAACGIGIQLASIPRAAAQPAESMPGYPASQRSRQAAGVLARDITSILADRNFIDASWGISVVSCDNGELLYHFQDARNRQVASNIKLLTTAAALHRLGGDYRYATDLFIGGTIGADGQLSGNLVIRTSGDPSISPSFGVDPRSMIRGWARSLDSLGIHSLQNVLVDAGCFDSVPYAPGWAWDDEPFGFNAQISGAAIYDNGIEVTVKPGREPGAPVSIDISPSTAYVSIKVTATTSRGDSASTLDIRRERGGSVITVSGNIAATAEPYVEHVSVDHPPLFFATLVKEELERNGIVVHGMAYNAADYPERFSYGSLRGIATWLSPQLRAIVAATNKQSLNLSAEMILKKLGREFMSNGSTAAGVEVVKRMLTEIGVDVEHIRLYDGSGLSRQDMIAPADITTLLRWAHRSPIASDFMESLAIAGRDGTLANRMRSSLAENNVVGKTGYLGGIRALSGYVRTRDGELLAYSIVANNYSVPTSVVNTAQDLIAMRLASFSRKG